MYPHPVTAREAVALAREQARLAERAGFDGVMTSEHHGGFPGYVPNPLQLAGWLLDATETIWAGPCPLLLPLYHWTHVAEQVAWLAARFPRRVAAGFAIGGLARDFEMAELDYAARGARFRAVLPSLVDALRGRVEGPLAEDPAIAACADEPIPVVSATGSPAGMRLSAKLGIGVLYDSLQTLDRLSTLNDVYADAGGQAARIAIRRVWVGDPPADEVEAQMDFYRGYAASSAQVHWGEGQELIHGRDGVEVAERLLAFARSAGCDAFNLRVHFKGIAPERVAEQIECLGAETLPLVKRELAGSSRGH